MDVICHYFPEGEINNTNTPIERNNVGNSKVNNQGRGSIRQDNIYKDDRYTTQKYQEQ